MGECRLPRRARSTTRTRASGRSRPSRVRARATGHSRSHSRKPDLRRASDDGRSTTGRRSDAAVVEDGASQLQQPEVRAHVDRHHRGPSLARRDRAQFRREAQRCAAPLATLLEAPDESLPEFWAEFAELGWLGLHVPEDVGGSGYGIEELVVVVEELGRAIAPGPFVPTVIASAVLAAAGDGDLRSRLPPRSRRRLARRRRRARRRRDRVATAPPRATPAWCSAERSASVLLVSRR